MIRKMVCLLFCAASLWGDPSSQEGPELTSLTAEPSTIIGGHVNVLTGDFQDFEEDLHIPAPEALHVQRCYCSSKISGGILRSRWSSNHEAFTRFDEGWTSPEGVSTKSKQEIQIPLGQIFHFRPKASKSKDQTVKIDKEFLSKGFTNTSQGVISAQTNPNNMFWIVKDKVNQLKFGSGRVLRFEKEAIVDQLPSGNSMEYLRGHHPQREAILYNSNHQRLGGVVYDGPTSSKDFKKDPHVVATSPDGRTAIYRFTPIEFWEGIDKLNYFLLQNVVRSDKPDVSYSWELMHCPARADVKITHIHQAQGRNLKCQYYKKGVNTVKGQQIHLGGDDWLIGRVAVISEPIGPGPELLPRYQFFYGRTPDGQEGCTGVYDALGYKTDYSYTAENRLKRITRYDADQKPYSQEQLFWGAKNSRQQTHLIARSFTDLTSQQILFNKAYHYDVKGNVHQEVLAGNITGRSSAAIVEDKHGLALDNGVDRQIRSYSYSDDDFNLLLTERTGSLVKKFSYVPGTNRILSCFHQNESAIFLRHFYAYDATGQVIEHIVDDGTSTRSSDLQGVTERKIERLKRSEVYPIGMPLEVTESYWDPESGQEKRLRTTVNQFNALGQMTKKAVYDGENNLFSVEVWSYDGHGNLLCHTNALGEQWTYGYDANDNRILEAAPDGESLNRYQYDYMNRLICTEHVSQGLTLTERTRYDLAGNPVATIDVYGNETEYSYDAFHRVIALKAPAVENLEGNLYRPVTQTVYDPLSLPVKRIDPEGHVTETRYSILGKPLLVRYPDGSEERFYYDLEGRLVETVAKSGVRTQFVLDVQGRPIRTSVFDNDGALLHETEAFYNAFHLLWETDPLGLVTSYRYDGAGRRVESLTGDLRTTYLYNGQGLLEKTIRASVEHPEEAVVHVTLYDALQRVIEERQENLQGEVIQAVRFGYDVKGNRVREERDTAAGLSITTIQYNAMGVPVARIDPLGNQGVVSCHFDFVNEQGQKVGRVESIDPLGIKTCVTQDALGRIVLTEKFDAQGKEVQKIRFWFNGLSKCLQTSCAGRLIRWEYDPLGRAVRQIEGYGTPEQKTTSYAYHLNGWIEKTEKPDGEAIHYAYDTAGRLSSVTAPGISYQYAYDGKGRLMEVRDLIQNTATLRHYDDLGHLTHETLANGLEVSSSYAAIGGVKETVFPDQSRVRYQYNGGRLEGVERLDASGMLLYDHRYLSFDRSGNPLQSALICGLGAETRQYDLKGASLSVQSPYVDEKMERNGIGQIASRSLNGETTRFSYDPLSQLTQENGLFQDSYACDSRYNRLEKNGKHHLYNALDQLLSDGEHSLTYDANGNMVQEGKNRYRYDALNRLIAMECGDTTIEYQYDAFDRCITRQEFHKGQNIDRKRMIYIGHEEVGSCDDAGTIQELRVLGKGIKAEIGAAIAIELKGIVYAPQHDHLGNVIALVGSDGKVCESYRYSAFGEALFYNGAHQRIRNSTLKNPWLYASKRHDRHLVHFGFRFYLPRIGRFITADPAGYSAGANPYAYVGNHPLHAIDPLGLKEDPINLYDRTHDRSSWEYNSPRTDYHERDSKGERGSSIFHYTGILWRHVIPIPILQDLGCALMHYLDKGTLTTFHPWKESKTSVGVIYGLESSRIAYVLIGGINTSHDQLMVMAEELSAMYGNVKVTVIHNGDHGIVADLLECVAMIFDIPMRSVDFTYKQLSEQLASVGGVEGNGMVKLTVFSQGALTGENALQKMSPAERACFHINTYGAAAIIPDKGYLYSKNTISNQDPIPLSASLPNYISARCGWMKGVEFLPARESVWGFDHRFMSKTYQQAMKNDAEKFKDMYRDRY